jgi:hypothetical protein
MGISENLLQHVWKSKQLPNNTFFTTNNEPLKVIQFGEHNRDAGPDFFNGTIEYKGHQITGNIEIHVRTSDWYKHKHQFDDAYNNVILHVVYEHDSRVNQTNDIPTIELKSYIKHLQHQKIIFKDYLPCNTQIKHTSSDVLDKWLGKLYSDRMNSKLDDINSIYHYTKQDLQETAFQTLAGAFGFKVNKEPFILLARHTPLQIIARYSSSLYQIEALLFGQAGFLEEEHDHPYFKMLQNEYEFIKYKHNLKPLNKSIWKYLRLRPANFPSLRIAQFASFLFHCKAAVSKFSEIRDYHALRSFLNAHASPFWYFHYDFRSAYTKAQPKLGSSALDNIALNAIIPLLLFYDKISGSNKHYKTCTDLLEEIAVEENKYIRLFSNCGIVPKTAKEGQAMIQLYKDYCSKKKCLECQIGKDLMATSHDKNHLTATKIQRSESLE